MKPNMLGQGQTTPLSPLKFFWGEVGKISSTQKINGGVEEKSYILTQIKNGDFSRLK